MQFVSLIYNLIGKELKVQQSISFRLIFGKICVKLAGTVGAAQGRLRPIGIFRFRNVSSISFCDFITNDLEESVD